MEYTDKEFCLEVWGPWACFTRPEFKVERVSYDVITPSAARAIFESILFKKFAMRWEITKIEILSPIKWHSIMRNEVGAVASQKGDPIFIESNRQQKNAMVLRDVRYRIYAKLIFIPPRKRKNPKEEIINRKDENPRKYYDMFERRASSGQCFSQPYLGTREFSAFFRLITDKDSLAGPIPMNKDLGYMLYDMDFEANERKPNPMFYRCVVNEGVIIVPQRGSNEIMR